jgi:hypothetical protein
MRGKEGGGRFSSQDWGVLEYSSKVMDVRGRYGLWGRQATRGSCFNGVDIAHTSVMWGEQSHGAHLLLEAAALSAAAGLAPAGLALAVAADAPRTYPALAAALALARHAQLEPLGLGPILAALR